MRRPYFVLIADVHAKVSTVRSDKFRDKFRARRNLMFLLLGAYVVSAKVLIKPHYFLKVILLFTCIQTVHFRKKIGHTKIFEIRRGLGGPPGTLRESL